MLSQLSFENINDTILLLIPLCGCIGFLFKIWYDFKIIKSSEEHRREDIEILLICMRGCLEGLVANGHNGEVKKALSTLNDYQAGKTAGRGKK